MAKGILIAAMDFTNVAADEFHDWYDLEHVPERERVPGFLQCQRWIGAQNPKYSVATYDLQNAEVLKGEILTTGEQVVEFEKKFSQYTGRRHVLAVSSCTGALHLSLRPFATVEQQPVAAARDQHRRRRAPRRGRRGAGAEKGHLQIHDRRAYAVRWPLSCSTSARSSAG